MFTGIPVAALDFYEDLEADNSKAFWTAHKHVYDTAVREPMLALVDALGNEFGDAKVFRPYRDVRFSKDKTPYKTHQGAFVALRPGVGYYLQIDAAGLLAAGGFYHATPAQLGRYRAALDDDRRAAQLERIVGKLRRSGHDVDGDKLKTRPRGTAPDHPRLELLRHRSMTARAFFESPPWIDSPRTADEVRAVWRATRPLVEWAADTLGESE
ncbi:DUF2461 domain-containing protein [Rhodococcus sp. HNM0569]|uniref:DUF2461 domain-containing protein n=1 Tax=Rhodococcus sp. HNM0569 TaxID=2716340 RepID=UPI00146F9376|nr:DUF2461 domain-containing protein [Rhodococcus sp. HNM0569]NLU82731.1 DUF2461 domain-containing protein [Rhodococcus sp. HNM0569]